MESKEKTVTQILDEVMVEICNDYCKYPDMCKKQEDLDTICENCPLEKL